MYAVMLMAFRFFEEKTGLTYRLVYKNALVTLAYFIDTQ